MAHCSLLLTFILSIRNTLFSFFFSFFNFHRNQKNPKQNQTNLYKMFSFARLFKRFYCLPYQKLQIRRDSIFPCSTSSRPRAASNCTKWGRRAATNEKPSRLQQAPAQDCPTGLWLPSGSPFLGFAETKKQGSRLVVRCSR
jgi:hypothetical protein